MAQTMGPRISGRGDHLEAAIAAPDDQTDPITLPAMQIQAAAIKRDQDRHVDESADDIPSEQQEGDLTGFQNLSGLCHPFLRPPRPWR